MCKTLAYGLDIGSQVLKASADERTWREPSAVLWGAQRQSGWRAYRKRRAELGSVACGLRPYLERGGGQVVASGERLSAVAAHAGVLRMLRKSVEADQPASPAAVFTIPDDWHSAGEIPSSIEQSGWRSLGAVREWVAAAVAAECRSNTLLLLSLGAGATRITIAERQGLTWTRLATTTVSTVSQNNLGAHLVQQVKEAAIATLRLDLTEQPESDQAVHDAIDDAMMHLQNGKTVVDIDLHGMNQRLDNKDVEAWFAGRDSLQETVNALVEKHVGVGSQLTVVAWGGLAGFAPVQSWLKRLRAGETVILPFDSLSRGAATIAARPHVYSAQMPDSNCCPQCGSLLPSCDEDCCSSESPLVPFWDSYRPLVDARKRAFLVRSIDDVEERKEIESARFRIGRDSRSDWVFPGDEFPVVSAAHAVIARTGDEFHLRDLESTNQTFVNGAAVKRRHLHGGDEIRLGRDGPCLRFEFDEHTDVEIDPIAGATALQAGVE